MSEFIVDTDAASPASMPFTKFVNESEARFAREHPEATVTALADTEIGKVILEQEAKVDAAKDELGETAVEMVEARAEQRGVPSDEIESSRVKLDAARATLDADIEKGHAAMDAFRDQAHHDIEGISDSVHTYAESHPDSHLNDVSPGAITDPHIQEQIQHDTQIAEA